MNRTARLVSAAVLASTATFFADTLLAQPAENRPVAEAAAAGGNATPDLKSADRANKLEQSDKVLKPRCACTNLELVTRPMRVSRSSSGEAVCINLSDLGFRRTDSGVFCDVETAGALADRLGNIGLSIFRARRKNLNCRRMM